MSSFFPYNPNPYSPIVPYYPNPIPRVKAEVWERYKKQVEESEGFDVDRFPELGGIGTVVTPQGPCGEHYVESLMDAIEEHNQRRQAEGRTSISLVRPIKFNIQIHPLNIYCTFVAEDDADGTERTYQAKLFIGSGKLHTIIFREKASSDVQDHVIMKDQYTQQPRGSGFIAYNYTSAVDRVIEDSHEINGKPVEIKRTIPKGAAQAKDFKTKKIFVGGIPTTVGEDELKNFFSKFGKVVQHDLFGFFYWDDANYKKQMPYSYHLL